MLRSTTSGCWGCCSATVRRRSAGKKVPQITRPRVYRVVREMLPREWLELEELLRLLEAEQLRNERASCSHAKRRAALRASSDTPP